MNTFISKKLGEVLAFARIGKDTVEVGKEGLLAFLEAENIEKIAQECSSIADRIQVIASEAECLDEVEEAATATDEKVRDMRDGYVGGEWDQADEVLEWTGFYTGAALVHWHLIMGAAEALGDEELQNLSREALQFYGGLFVLDEETLHTIGKNYAEDLDENVEDDE